MKSIELMTEKELTPFLTQYPFNVTPIIALKQLTIQFGYNRHKEQV